MARTPSTAQLRATLLTIYFAILAIMAYGAANVRLSDDASNAMLEKQGVAYQRYLEYLDYFPSDVGVVVVAKNLFCTEAGWELIQDLETAYRSHPYIRKSISVASPSARYIQAQSNLIKLDSYTDVSFAADERCSKAYEYAPFKELLVAKNGEAVAIYLIAEDDVDSLSFSKAVLSVRENFQKKAVTLGGEILITGDPIMSSEIARVIERDMVWVVGLVVLLILSTFFITRSPITCLASFLTMAFSLLGAFGFMGWFDIEITPGTALAIFLLSPLSAAFVIHAHGYASRSITDSMFPPEAILPTIFAGVTTGTLFACTGLTPAPDVRSLALLGVIGIAFATLATFLVAYPLLSLSRQIGYSINFAIPRWALVRPWFAYLLLTIFLVEIIVGFSKIRFEYEAVDYLPLSNQTRSEFEAIGQWFGRMSIPVMIHSDKAVSDPETWRQLELLERKIESEIVGTHSASFYDTLSELTQAFTNENPEGPIEFPKDRSLLSQLLILFDPDDYEPYIGQESQRISFTLHVPFIGSSEYFKLKEVVNSHFADLEIDGVLVGRVSGFFETGHRIGIDNLKGLAIGGALVFLMLVYLFRSVKLSAIGLLVNSIPVLTSLAALGLAGVPIDLGSSIVTAMAFGIVVDDSTHLIIRINRLQTAGYDPATAVVRATRELIAPIMTTTAMICMGFCVLFAAEMKPFHDFAATIMIAMITALVADLIILPVLVRSFVKDTLHKEGAA